jgi:hypothetical protein
MSTKNPPGFNSPNPQLSTELIAEFNVLYNQLIPNKSKGGIIELSNEQKEVLSPIISNLANRIYKKAIMLRSGPEFNTLREKLYSLYSLYMAIFIDKFREYRQNLKNVQGVANNKKRIAINLNKKEKEIRKIYENQIKKKSMNISYRL